MSLSKEIEDVIQARLDLAKSNRDARRYMRIRAGVLIESADAVECLDVLESLIDRVAELFGEASMLEDAACDLQNMIEAQEATNNPPLCSACNGSGLGMSKDHTCWACKGKGSA
ncbi:zinc finger domain protein [Caudoviricetes sp.]|nr:zinc finger domain protein [Caudoviricetes sp.]